MFVILQRQKFIDMKKLAIIPFLFTILILGSCNSVGGNKDDNNPPAAENTGKVVYLTTDMFQKEVWDYKKNPDQWVFKGDLPCIIDFYADWCRPCKMVAPIMEELAQEYKGKVRIYKINTDQEKELASVFNIRSIPAVLFIPKDGKPQMSVGALPKPTFVQAINDVLLAKENTESK
jgi:thioredoxin